MFEKQIQNSDNSQLSSSQVPPNIGDNPSALELEPENTSANSSLNHLQNSKFKSVDELAKAYIELEKKHGLQAREVGNLRKIAEQFQKKEDARLKAEQQLKDFQNFLLNIEAKYQSDNYLKNKEFREILKTAYTAFGNNLDVDAMVNMLENYLNSRNALASKISALQDEANSATDMLAYSNGQSKYKAPKKRLSEMSPEELDKALDELM